jgi:DNA-binding MurR/RpiR family transcriptional regulator
MRAWRQAATAPETSRMAELQQVLDRLGNRYGGLSPQLKRAAKYVLDHPAEVGVHSMRRLAGAAAVPPSTMTRLVRALEFGSYESFRQPFQDALRGPAGGYRDRARGLQETAEDERGVGLLADMLEANLAGLEGLSATIGPAELHAAAQRMVAAKRVFVLGLRGCFALAHYLYYVGRMALPRLVLLRGQAGPLIDELADIGAGDVLLAIAVDPYTRETVRATRFAAQRGAAVIAVTDSRASPLVRGAAHALIAPTASPQFFPSSVAIMALLEALIASVVVHGGEGVIDNIARADRLLADFGAYWQD